MKDLYYLFSILTFFVISSYFLSSEKALNDQINQYSSAIELAEEVLLAPGRFWLESHSCNPVEEQICCCSCVGVGCGITSAICEIPAIFFVCVKGGAFECGSGLGCDSVASGANCYSCCSLACGA